MKAESPVIVPGTPDSPPVVDGSPSQASALMRFFVCLWPDFYAMMNLCDRDLYQWIERFPWNNRPWYLSNEQQRIANAAYQQQYQQWSSCEAGRYSSQSEPKSGMRLAVSSRLAGGGIAHDESASAGIAARLSVSFAPGSGPTPPPPCTPGSDPTTWPKIPFHFLHKVDKLGINYYPQNTVVEFTSNYSDTYWKGIGPWEGSKVFIAWSLNGWSLSSVQNYFHMEAKVRSKKVFDHWVSFKTISNPAPPANLLVRSEAFNIGSLQVQTSAPFNWNAPEGQRGQGWHIFIEYTHIESDQSWVVERWLETDVGWNPVGLGGYSAEHSFWDYIPNDLGSFSEADGSWYHRVCVYDFKRLPTAVSVIYNGVQMESGFSSITPLMTTPYVPGVSQCIASCDETITVRTVGATKASFRIVGVEPVPGFGVLFKIKVVNELHFAACIVTPFLSGIGDRTSWQNNVMNFYMPTVWVVRNLAAYSESDTISILVPMQIVHDGDWPLLDMHWRMYIAQEAYPAPLNQCADGIYGGWPGGPNPNIGAWPPPGYKISSNPEQYAFLLAGYLENGDKVWHSSWDSTVDTNRLLMTMPAHKAPGAEVMSIIDPRFGVTYPTYFDQVPFLGFFEWSVEYKIGSNPDVWDLRSGQMTIGLDLQTAIGRYGRTLTLNVAAGRPMWSPYYQKWVTVFDAWPGGSADELETYLVDTYLRPRAPASEWRNFQYTALKKPFLTTNVMWWFENQPIDDRPGYIHALTLIKESNSADTVDVMLMGYW